MNFAILAATGAEPGMAFGVPALMVVGASWCLTGAILGRAPKDGLDTGMVQLGSAAVSLAICSVQQNLVAAPSHFEAARAVSPVLRAMASATGTVSASIAALAWNARRGNAAGVRERAASLLRGRLWLYAGGMQF